MVGEVSRQCLCTASSLFFTSFSHLIVYAAIIQSDYHTSILGTCCKGVLMRVEMFYFKYFLCKNKCIQLPPLHLGFQDPRINNSSDKEAITVFTQ